jgi:hypothetical protein
MGDINQLTYLKRFMPSVPGPILEIGSKDYGSTSTFRNFYANDEYVGVDMEAGNNVDVVVDLTQDLGGLRANHFALAICCSVLEHVRKPWLFATRVTSLLRAGGALYLSVPWVWRYHAYPDDYYRFSWRGVMELFPDFEWSNICYSTNVPNEFIDIAPDEPGADNSMAAFADTPAGRRKYLPYLMVNMLGRRIQIGSNP